MKSRLSNWLQSAKLAKLHLAQARLDLDEKNFERAGKNMVNAMELIMTGMHNLQSLAFGEKPKAKRRVDHRKYIGPRTEELNKSLNEVKS